MVRVRFAPSPTGHLHVGNVRTALYNWLFARQDGGTFILRIEDTDLERSESRFEEQLKEDLRWLGLSWDEGVDAEGNCGPYRQTQRFDLYRAHAEQLLKAGRAYHCFCSPQTLEQERKTQLAEGRSPRYSGKCRAIEPEQALERVGQGEKAVLRLKVRAGTVGFNDEVFGPLEVNCAEIGDFVLLRSDGSAQYNFACVVDDVLMKITDVIRGEGHVPNTYRQVLVYEAFGFETPRFAHLSTILGGDGAKLSKRHGAASIDEVRRQGYLPQALVNYLALLGWAPPEEDGEILTVAELVERFDLSRVNRSPATFDWEKLNWVNRSHLKKLDTAEVVELIVPYLHAQGWVPEQPSKELIQWLVEVVETLFKYLDKLEDIILHAKVIFDFDPRHNLSDPDIQQLLSDQSAGDVIREFWVRVEGQEDLDVESYRAVVEEVKQATGLKGKGLFHPIRIALTARSKGPELDKLVDLLHKGRRLELPVKIGAVRERVKAVADYLP